MDADRDRRSVDSDSARLFDHPRRDGAGPEVQAAWDARCLLNVDTLRDHRDALAQISMVGVVVPSSGNKTNRSHNLRLVEAMRRVGVVPQVLNVRGTHGSHRPERFIFLAGLVTSVMPGPSFDTSDSRTLEWGALKDAQWQAGVASR